MAELVGQVKEAVKEYQRGADKYSEVIRRNRQAIKNETRKPKAKPYRETQRDIKKLKKMLRGIGKLSI